MQRRRSRIEAIEIMARWAYADARRRLRRRRLLVLGWVAGGMAFAVTFAATYHVEHRHVVDPSGTVLSARWHEGGDYSPLHTEAVGPDGPLPDAVEFATWQFHRLHGVELSPEYATITVVGPADSLHLLPPAVLVAAGALLTLWIRPTNLVSAVRSGAAVSLGYLPLAVYTATSTGWNDDTKDLGSYLYYAVPDVDALVWTGLTNPLVFGGVGGVLAFALLRWVRRSTDDERDQ